MVSASESLTAQWHWRYRVEALSRDVTVARDVLNAATAYRSGATDDELAEHRDRLAVTSWLLSEARHHVEAAS